MARVAAKCGVTLSLLVIAFSALWFVADRHRENCIHDGRVSCSVLPWHNGRAARSIADPKATPMTPEQAILCEMRAERGVGSARDCQ